MEAIIAERIKAKRKELGWTQPELAEKMGYNKSTVLRIERGEVNLPQSRISQFARVLGTTPGYLMGWDVEPEEAGATAAKVLRSAETYRMMQNYFNMSEEDQQVMRNLAEALAAKKKTDGKASVEESLEE